MYGGPGGSSPDYSHYGNDVGVYFICTGNNYRSGNNRPRSDGSTEHVTSVDG